MLETNEPAKAGYCPRYLNEDLRRVLYKTDVHLTVERLNIVVSGIAFGRSAKSKGGLIMEGLSTTTATNRGGVKILRPYFTATKSLQSIENGFKTAMLNHGNIKND